MDNQTALALLLLDKEAHEAEVRMAMEARLRGLARCPHGRRWGRCWCCR